MLRFDGEACQRYSFFPSAIYLPLSLCLCVTHKPHARNTLCVAPQCHNSICHLMLFIYRRWGSLFCDVKCIHISMIMCSSIVFRSLLVKGEYINISACCACRSLPAVSIFKRYHWNNFPFAFSIERFFSSWKKKTCRQACTARGCARQDWLAQSPCAPREMYITRKSYRPSFTRPPLIGALL